MNPSTKINSAWNAYHFNKMGNVLIIGSSGGEGHNAAANAIEQQLQMRNPSATVIKKDLLKDFVGPTLSNNGVEQWNNAQKKGDVSTLNSLFKIRSIGEFIFATPVFLKTVWTLLRNDIDTIVDTQAIGTKQIILAARVANVFRSICFWKNKQIRILKIMTDLPNNANHFFDTIKTLNKEEKALLTLYSSVPLTDTLKKWTKKEQKGFQWKLAAAPLRPAFSRIHKDTPATNELPIQPPRTQEECKMFIECINKGKGIHHALIRTDNKIRVKVDKDEMVNMVMLGSQAAELSTLKYVTKHIAIAQKDPNQKYTLFLFCGKGPLMKKVHKTIKEMNTFPKNLTIIPLGYQSDNEIAPIMRRCNNLFTRSGGLTSMEELNTVNPNHSQVFIHTEANKVENYKEGILTWEAGNADYLKKHLKARIMTPGSLRADHLKR